MGETTLLECGSPFRDAALRDSSPLEYFRQTIMAVQAPGSAHSYDRARAHPAKYFFLPMLRELGFYLVPPRVALELILPAD